MVPIERRAERKELPADFKIVGFVGQVGSGKGTAAEVLKKEQGFRNYTFSQILRDYARQQGMVLSTRNDYWSLRNTIVKRYGSNYFLETLMNTIKSDYASAAVPFTGATIDGFRNIRDAYTFQRMPNTLLVGMSASPYHRYWRARNRSGRPEDQVSWEEFYATELGEGQEVNKIMRLADVVIVNEGTPEELTEKVKRVFSQRFTYGQ